MALSRDPSPFCCQKKEAPTRTRAWQSWSLTQRTAVVLTSTMGASPWGQTTSTWRSTAVRIDYSWTQPCVTWPQQTDGFWCVLTAMKITENNDWTKISNTTLDLYWTLNSSVCPDLFTKFNFSYDYRCEIISGKGNNGPPIHHQRASGVRQSKNILSLSLSSSQSFL